MRIEGYEFKTDFLRDAFAQGRAEGRIEATRHTLVVFLESRGLEPTPREHQCIIDCQDPDRLEEWVRKAAIVERVADLFE